MISVIDKTLQSYIGPNAFLFLNLKKKTLVLKDLNHSNLNINSVITASKVHAITLEILMQAVI